MITESFKEECIIKINKFESKFHFLFQKLLPNKSSNNSSNIGSASVLSITLLITLSSYSIPEGLLSASSFWRDK